MLATVGTGLLALIAALIMALIATYVWSSDAGRRRRSREMLVLLLSYLRLPNGRRISSTFANVDPPWMDKQGQG